jgi:hypothetical protein
LNASGFLRIVCPWRPAHDFLRLRLPAFQSHRDCVWLFVHTSSPAGLLMTACGCRSLPARSNLTASGLLSDVCPFRPAQDCLRLRYSACQSQIVCVCLLAQTSAPAGLLMTACVWGPFIPEPTRLHLATCAVVCPSRPAHDCLLLRYPACERQLDCVWLPAQRLPLPSCSLLPPHDCVRLRFPACQS